VQRYMSGPRRELGHEPDYRFTLANERTFLAWIRTALALIGGGLAVFQILGSLAPGARQLLGAVLIVLGTLLALLSLGRWTANEEALRTDAPLPSTHLPLVLAGGIAVVAVIATVLILGAPVP
jgi:putative membrane protein